MDNIFAILLITLIGLLGGVLLVAANHFFAVTIDTRTEEITTLLPGANCGACGFSSCAAYANAIVENGAALTLCIPGGMDCVNALSAVMQTKVVHITQQKAVVTCQGNLECCGKQYVYDGIQTCAACSQFYNGDTQCSYGCLGYGDCLRVCKFDAISIKNGIAEIDLEKCTGCGCCKDICPKHIILLRPQNKKPSVLCANHQRGTFTKAICSTGCIGCGRCVRACKLDAITLKEYLAEIDLKKCIGCGACISTCPVHAIALLAKPI